MGSLGSFFADVTYSLLKKLDVSTGVRFSYDERDLDYHHINTLSIPGVFAPAQQAKKRATFRNWSPRFVASYHWSPQLLTYVSISRGYKAGSFNTFLVSDTQFTFAAESAWNYEVGLKYTLFEERVAVNVAAFYFDWQDPQVSIYNGFYFTTSNASRARSFGGDWELLARPFPGIRFIPCAVQRRSPRSPRTAAIPTSAHGPQLMLTAGNPSDSVK